MNSFTRSLLASAAVVGALAAGSTVVLADKYVAPAAKGGYSAIPAYYNWGGLYLGGNIGGAWSDADWQYINPAGPAGAVSRDPSGPVYGIHGGIQHQYNRFVIGIEMSHSGPAFSRIEDRGQDAPAFAAVFDSTVRLHNVFTLGPRLGFAVADRWLLYVTGGYANAKYSSFFTNRITGVDGGFGSRRHDGWFIGGGFEYAMTENWVVGFEYLHLDFDSEIHAAPAAGVVAAGSTRTISPEADIFRSRISFKLNRPAPVPEGGTK